jgi:putative transposase
VEPACAVLEISPSTYYAARKREEEPSARDARDEELKKEIMRVWKEKGRRVYGARKVWRQLHREGIAVARCTVERLMGDLGIAGAAARKKRPRTTVPGPAGQVRPSDLLERDFTAPAPNRRWVADITYQYTAIRYAERLGDISAVRSVGRKGDSYDNAAAELLNSLYKKELIDREGPWRGVDDVMLATLEWVAWYNAERLHSACGEIPPGEYEDNYYARQESLVR